MVAVVVVGGEEEHAEFGTVEAAGIGGVDLWAADVLGRVRPDPSVDVRESVEPADRREPPVNRRGCQAAIVHPGTKQLNVRASRVQHRYRLVDRPLKEAPQVVSGRVESPTAVAGQERRRSKLSIIDQERGLWPLEPGTCSRERGHGVAS